MLKYTIAVAILAIAPMSFAEKFSQRNDILLFINNMHTKHNLDQNELISYFDKFESSDEIIRKISTPYEAQPWSKYSKNFLQDDRIKQGVAFYKTHYKALALAEKKTGVPKEIIVGIIGVETFYGTRKGSFPVIQALATLGFDYKPRSAFFLKELEEFLLLSKQHRLDPTTVVGSYAGAIGIPQFMPSSYRHYAADFVQQQEVDLVNNPEQAIYSVANYLSKHGWQRGKDIVYEIKNIPHSISKFDVAPSNAPMPNIESAALRNAKIHVPKKLTASHKVALLKYDNEENGDLYYLGDYNFYVITRYNHNINYAMAVYQLSSKIQQAKLISDKANNKT